MTHYGWPVLFVLFLWWFSTGLAIYLNHRPKHTYRWSVAGATVLLVGSLIVSMVLRWDVSLLAAYAGFACALLVWAWTQLTFYMGFLTGPRRKACAAECVGIRHYWHAVETCLYHELAAAGLALALYGISFGAANRTAFWTYFILWGMHLIAKVNVVLGVRNLNAQFFPKDLMYLRSFLKERPMNPFFPFAAVVSAGVTIKVGEVAFSQTVSSFTSVTSTFYFTLLLLAVVELIFLVLPFPFAALWNWAIRVRKGRPQVKLQNAG